MARPAPRRMALCLLLVLVMGLPLSARAQAPGTHHLSSNPTARAIVFGGQPVIPQHPFKITILVNGTVTGQYAPVALTKHLRFNTRAILRLAERAGFFALPHVISGNRQNVDNGPRFITIFTVEGKKKVILSPTGQSDVFNRLYGDLMTMVQANAQCRAPEECASVQP